MRASTVCVLNLQLSFDQALISVGIAGPYTNFSTQGEYSYSTSFPQPILMGAAFDDALITEVATVISTEARAFNNANRLVSSSKPFKTFTKLWKEPGSISGPQT
jgi:hypothetical protein